MQHFQTTIDQQIFRSTVRTHRLFILRGPSFHEPGEFPGLIFLQQKSRRRNETFGLPGHPKVCFRKVFRYIKPTKKHSFGCPGGELPKKPGLVKRNMSPKTSGPRWAFLFDPFCHFKPNFLVVYMVKIYTLKRFSKRGF